MAIAMPRKKKTADQMTDAELARKVFPARVRNQLKQLMLELDEKPKRKPPTRKPKA
jgi:hypothetical protein